MVGQGCSSGLDKILPIGRHATYLHVVARTHELKTLYPWMTDVLSGAKNFEVRRDDRNFQVGDILCLRGYRDSEYTGEDCRRSITYILPGGDFGIEQGYVVLGLGPENS